MSARSGRGRLIAWQVLFLLFSTSWLLAPALVHSLSYRSTLISQYEAIGQPYAMFFRLCDITGALLLLWFAFARLKSRLQIVPFCLLTATAAGMLLDPIFVTECGNITRGVCYEAYSLSFLLHAIESVLTAAAIAALAVYDAVTRRLLASVLFVLFQIGYGILFFTKYASHAHFNTVSQFTYQCVVMLWLAWYCHTQYEKITANQAASASPFRASLVRRGVAGWMLLNGLLAIIISLAHIHLLGNIKELYFAGQNAWLAQHGVIIGVVMLYLSRHLLRGEMRARQILLAIVGAEVIKYAAISPNLPLVAVYSVTFCLLFVTVDDFKRGALPMTRQIRFKDLAYMVIVLLLAALIALLVLDRDNRVARIASRSYSNFTEYALHSDSVHLKHRDSVLLADTVTAFLTVSAGTILWILFKPYKVRVSKDTNSHAVRQLLERYSDSSEDFFKLWPTDKQYFFTEDTEGFIAYKIVGSVAFALADPIGPPASLPSLVEQFVSWSMAHRLRTCFLALSADSHPIYEGMNILQIGASALIDTAVFTEKTVNDKWWRWKRNRAANEGYRYAVHSPPHSAKLLQSLRSVSDSWLEIDEHKEYGFALGYYDEGYMQQCEIHSLYDSAGETVAFTNRLPALRKLNVASIDLLRHRKEAVDAMPFLLSSVIATAHEAGYRYFDLGFVPFAGAKGSLLSIARALSAGRFSAKGLEQFKNKFDPEWQASYMAYDGDTADLALIALNLEKTMEIPGGEQ